jgi:hypothetical protein
MSDDQRSEIEKASPRPRRATGPVALPERLEAGTGGERVTVTGSTPVSASSSAVSPSSDKNRYSGGVRAAKSIKNASYNASPETGNHVRQAFLSTPATRSPPSACDSLHGILLLLISCRWPS